MMKFLKYALPCAFLFLAACGGDKMSSTTDTAISQNNGQVAQKYTFEKQNYTIGKLPESSVYEFTGIVVKGENAAALAKINAIVEQTQKELLTQEKSAIGNKTVQELINEDIASWFEQEKETYFHGYDKNVIFKGHTTQDLVVVEYTAYEMTGGAHGNGYTGFLNFDAKTGDTIPAQKLFKNIAEVEEIIFPIFIEQAKEHFQEPNIDANDLNASGFQFEDNKFVLANNITIEGDNVIFYYNPYEIGPYAMGDFLLKIPKAKLANQLLYN